MAEAGLLTRILGGVVEIGRLARAVAREEGGEPDDGARVSRRWR